MTNQSCSGSCRIKPACLAVTPCAAGSRTVSDVTANPKARVSLRWLAEGQAPLGAEVRAVRERYGSRATLRQRGDTLYWEYVVHESKRSFPIEVRYPASYPIDPPEIFSVKPLPLSPHQLSAHQPCWLDVYSSHSEWNPARDTAVICINAAHRWFACLLVYLTLGHWPEGADH